VRALDLIWYHKSHVNHMHCVSQKARHLTFEFWSYLWHCRLIFKILSLPDSEGNFILTHSKIFHLTLSMFLLHDLVKLENHSCILHVRPQNLFCKICGHPVAQIWILMTTRSGRQCSSDQKGSVMSVNWGSSDWDVSWAAADCCWRCYHRMMQTSVNLHLY